MQKQINKTSGFTLIELSIVLLIVGIIVAALATPYKLYVQEQQRQTTVANIEKVTAALNAHIIQNGRYPCPASLTAARGNANYGVESQCDAADPAYPAAATAGTCNGGLCFEDGARQVDMNPDPAVTNMQPTMVRRGSIPFRNLQLTEQEALDGYGGRIQYAVTEHLAVIQQFIQGTGAINIVDAAGQALVSPAGSANFVVFSTGPDKNGAFSQDGQAVRPCAIARVDGENCNTSAANDTAIYSNIGYADTGNANHYDDRMVYSASEETPLWRVADANGLHIRDLVDAETAGGRIGIGTGAPAVSLEVADDVYVQSAYALKDCHEGTPGCDPATMDVCAATDSTCIAQGDTVAAGFEFGQCDKNGANCIAEGRIMTDFACDANGANCIDVKEFGGDSPQFECPPGSPYVQTIGNNQVTCTDKLEFRCAPGQIAVGLDADGLVCDTVVGCPTKNIELCFNSAIGARDPYVIPASISGATHQTAVSGDSYSETWVCRDSGQWRRTRTSGVCNCTPADNTFFQNCRAYKNYVGYWDGQIEKRTVTTCPGRNTTTTLTGNGSCTCRPETETRNANCPNGFTGSKTISRDWTCQSPDQGQFSNWVTTSDTCTCDPSKSQTRTRNCPNGLSGSGIQERRNFDCSSNSWGPWQETQNNCTCSGSTQQQIVGCPAPQVGNVVQERTFNCSTSTWSAWTDVSANCGARVLKWRTKSPRTGPNSTKLSKKAGASCSVEGQKKKCYSDASSGFWHYDECECEYE